MVRAIGAQGIGAVFTALVSFALLVYLGRVLGTETFGHYVAVLNTALLGLILIEGGWPTLVYRETAGRDVAAGHGDRLSGQAVAHMLVAASLLVVLTLGLHGLGLTSLTLPAALLCMLAVGLMNLVSARLRGVGRFGHEALWQGSGRVASALLIVASVLWFSTRLPWLFIAWAAGLAFVLCFGGRRWLVLPRYHGIAAGYRLVLPFLVVEGLIVFLIKGDMALLGVLEPAPKQLSYYAACSRLTEAAVLLFSPVSNVLLRSFRQTRSAPQLGRLVRTMVALALLAGLSAVLLSWLFGPRLMPLLFGPSFRPAGALLPWLAAILPFALSNLILFQALIAQGRERRLALILVLGALLMCVAMSIGVHFAGIRGAAIGLACTHALVFVVCSLTMLWGSHGAGSKAAQIRDGVE